MRRRRRSRADVVELIVDRGGSPEVAEGITEALASAGLSPDASRSWPAHPTRAYYVVTGRVSVGGFEYPRQQTPIFAIEDGHAEAVREAASRFAGASEDERFIALWFGGDIDDVRRLTGGDEVRTSATRGIAERLRAQLRKREHVYEVAQTVLPDHGGKRMVDLVLEGREDVVLADLAEGRIDPRDVLATGRLENHGW